jgi:hypothetical protein
MTVLVLSRGLVHRTAGSDQCGAHGRDRAGDLIEQRRIAAERRELALPQIEIALGQLGEVGRLGHGVWASGFGGSTIAKPLACFHLLRRGAKILALHNRA